MFPSKITCLCGLVATTTIAACSFSVNGGTDTVIDGPVDAVPDASMCTEVSDTCVEGTDVLRRCTTPNAFPEDETCAWACVPAAGPTQAHCGVFTPAGGSVTEADILGTADHTIMSGTPTIVDGNMGKIAGVSWPSRMDATNAVTVFQFRNLTINSTVHLFGARAIAFVASGDITINGVIEGRGAGCNPPAASPGGFRGGLPGMNAMGSGAGTGGATAADGAGGGGHGSTGGDGGSPVGVIASPGGAVFGDETITLLIGGGGGGGGGDSGSSDGGGGGAAIQLVAKGRIWITSNGGINAGGCGGGNGGGNDSGGGGGAGGTILIEGRRVELDANAKLAVNGGGGGAGDGGSDGEPGQLARMAAAGGTIGTGANGGAGGAPGALAGQLGIYTLTAQHAGGGGGAIGRIRINTRSGAATIDAAAILSPSLTDTPTTATQGALKIQ